ncbi:purine-cytosine permease family protein [Streptomyces fuscigenes]|uniref:purine-cytosine permease family protein n=1 Tax=Streptomyces fuscigenes TaxID=1528880 RepID=UPI001F3A85E4|nr:cytosine permease [Streptomyces fuscigenes]MCF3963202.1 cytosine permease [Streptomyces fuscigenes]
MSGAPSHSTVETRGLDPVPDGERTGRVRALFPTWAGANITVLLVTVGAGFVVSDGLALWQVLVVAAVAPALSFGIVGLISLAGKRGGAPGMALSRAVFGQRGNLLPGALIWLARCGWEIANAVTGAYALLTVARLLAGVRGGALLDVAALVVFVAASCLVSAFGILALRGCARGASYLFAAFSVAVFAYLAGHADWSAVLGRRAGSPAAVVAAVGTLAGGGLSWAATGPDLTRYLPREVRGRAVVARTAGGALVVTVPLLAMGAVLAAGAPGLAATSDPVAFIGRLLPTWLAVPYLVTALAGMVLINSLSMYSAAFMAQAVGIRVSRTRAVALNAIASVVLGAALMLLAASFLDAFLSFLSLLGVAFAAWAGVFGADMATRRRYDPAALAARGPGGGYWYRAGFAPSAVGAWGAALAVGALFTRVEWFTGPLASTWVGRGGLGWVATILTGAGLYAVLPRARPADRDGGGGTGTAPGAGRAAAPGTASGAREGTRRRRARRAAAAGVRRPGPGQVSAGAG